LTAAILVLMAGISRTAPAAGHCDTTKGPVIMAARAALDAGDPNLVLHWIRAEDESTIRVAFQSTMEVRALGPKAAALADRFFFETLVRIHRAGEGAPFTGLTDGEPEAIIVATDRALAGPSADQLEETLVGAVRAGLGERFRSAVARKDFRSGDVAAGRAFVAAYVSLTHWVDGVFNAATGSAEHHTAANNHVAGSPAATHEPHDPEGHSTPNALGRHSRPQLPWVLVGLLATAVFVQGALSFRRRRVPT
jgi:hypothetical protein